MQSSRWLIPADVAKSLRVPAEDVERWIDAGEFFAIQLPNGQRRIDATSLRDFLNDRLVGSGPRGLRGRE